jgi:hypothetical protein
LAARFFSIDVSAFQRSVARREPLQASRRNVMFLLTETLLLLADLGTFYGSNCRGTLRHLHTVST